MCKHCLIPVTACLFLDCRWLQALAAIYHLGILALLFPLHDPVANDDPRFLVDILSEIPLLEFIFKLCLPRRLVSFINRNETRKSTDNWAVLTWPGGPSLSPRRAAASAASCPRHRAVG